MKTLISLASLCLACQVASAGTYVKASMLFADVENLKGSGSFSAAVDNSVGYGLGVGYRFTILAIELEGMSLKNDISGIEGAGATNASGDFEQANVFANAIVHIPGIPLVKPYVGVGIGLGSIDAKGRVTRDENTGGNGGINGPSQPVGLFGDIEYAADVNYEFDESDTAFGYQIFAGVRVSVPLTGLSVFGQYRYYDFDSVEIGNIAGSALESGGTTAIELGAIYEF